MFKFYVFVLLMFAIALPNLVSALTPSDLLKAGQAMISNATSIFLGSATDGLATANGTIAAVAAAANATVDAAANATTIAAPAN